MVTAKMPGVKTPCQKRQKSNCPRLPDKPARMVGTARRNAAGTMTFRRPKRSAIMPVNGAVTATARVETVTTNPMVPADA
jgi:hypothetical protein